MLKAKSMQQNQPNQIITTMWEHYPVSAARYCSLHEKLGEEDMFSSDLTREELDERLGHIKVPCLLLFCGKDQYVPSNIDTTKLAKTVSEAISSSIAVILSGSDHSVSDLHSQEQLAKALTNFLADHKL